MTLSFILIPFISALIGWMTNYLAIKMLFHPRTPKKIFFFTLHGIFPKRQAQIADKIGNMVSSELFSVQDLRDQLTSEETSELLLKQISDKIALYFDEKLAQKFPLIGSFLSGGIKESIQSEFLKEIKNMLPSILDALFEKVESSIDIQKIVEQKVKGFSSEKLEQILNDILKKEFKFIELIGAVIGFIVGLVQIALFYILG